MDDWNDFSGDRAAEGSSNSSSDEGKPPRKKPQLAASLRTKQISLFGAWRLPEKPKPHTSQGEHLCDQCDFRAGGAGPLAVHKTMKHGAAKPPQALVVEPDSKLDRYLKVLDADHAREEVVVEGPVAVDPSEASDEEPIDNAERSPPSKRRGAASRKSYPLKTKVRYIKLYDLAAEEMKKNDPAVTQKGILAALGNTGKLHAPMSSIKKWVVGPERDKILEAYADVKKRKLRSVGSGRKPAWPAAEQRTVNWIREKRDAGLRVLRRVALKMLKKEIIAEIGDDAGQLSKFKNSRNLFHNFLSRHKLRNSSVSSTKAVTNQEAERAGRYMMQCYLELRKSGTCPGADLSSWALTHSFDPFWGHFPPHYILAVDEVPINFLETGKTLNFEKESAAVKSVTSAGKRAATLLLAVSTSGDILKPMLIFKSKKGLKNSEMQKFQQYDNVIVATSESSYINHKLYRGPFRSKVLLPYCRSLDPESKDWFLLSADNHTAHYEASVLRDLIDDRILPVFSPANQTPWWMLIDDGIGSGYRSCIYEHGFEWEEKYMLTHPNGAVSAPERRLLLVKWTHEVFDELSKSEPFKRRIINAGARCGMRFPLQAPNTPQIVRQALALPIDSDLGPFENQWKKFAPPRFHNDPTFDCTSYIGSIYFEVNRKYFDDCPYTFTFSRPDESVHTVRFTTGHLEEQARPCHDETGNSNSEEFASVDFSNQGNSDDELLEGSEEQALAKMQESRRRVVCGIVSACGCDGQGRGDLRLCICSRRGVVCDNNCGCVEDCKNRSHPGELARNNDDKGKEELDEGDAEEERIPSSLLEKSKRKKLANGTIGFMYKVRWFLYDETKDTWEPEYKLPAEMVAEYNERNG